MNRYLTTVIIVILLSGSARAQDMADPLTFQGMEHYNPLNVRSRAMGGSGVAALGQVSALFSNPASLADLSGLEISVGGSWRNLGHEQSQRWNPNRFYADLSIMLENRFDNIKDPEIIRDSTDFLHKPFDDLKPAWKNDNSSARPSAMAAGIPFSLAGLKFAAGVGFSEWINLDHYYQNNNALGPNIGNYRPSPLPIVAQGDTLLVEWYQFIRQREGAVYGIAPALALTPVEGVSLGLSLAVLTGSSDDIEIRNDRGHLRLLYNSYLLDSVHSGRSVKGKSEYSGLLPTIGCLVNQEYYSIGVTLRPPSTIERKWSETATSVDGDTTLASYGEGTDKMKMPWFYALGIMLHPSEKVNLSVDYLYQQYAGVTYSSQEAGEISPWVSSKAFRVGVEYNHKKWLSLRAGAREEIQAFAPAGQGLIGEPAPGAVYSAGFGIRFANVTVNGAYEYGILKYNDLWQSNVNTNRVRSHCASLELGYKIN